MKDILKELNVNYKITNLICNSNFYILINVRDLDKLTWMRNKYHPLSLKEFLEVNYLDYNTIQDYLKILNIELIKPYNKSQLYFKNQEDCDKLANVMKNKIKRMDILYEYKYGMNRHEFLKKENEIKNKYIDENKIFTSRSASKYLGIDALTFKSYVNELGIKPIGKIKKIYDSYSIEQVEYIKKVRLRLIESRFFTNGYN